MILITLLMGIFTLLFAGSMLLTFGAVESVVNLVIHDFIAFPARSVILPEFSTT